MMGTHGQPCEGERTTPRMAAPWPPSRGGGGGFRRARPHGLSLVEEWAILVCEGVVFSGSCGFGDQWGLPWGRC